jgi:fructan beta-fructosidase
VPDSCRAAGQPRGPDTTTPRPPCRQRPGITVFITLIAMAIGAHACSGAAVPTLPLTEPYRPQYHFSPAAHWMNDPNGLVYADGKFHLFYQDNPAGTVWGPMHWGHAVSTDLVNWQHLPIALNPDDLGNIFSGSAVIDQANTAGFGTGALVAVFTQDRDGVQRQSLAYSTDQGQTWVKYAGNPVLNLPNNLKNFRDPKVFWFDDGGAGHWVMLVAAGSIILFYTSPDLKQWTAASGFGLGYGSTAGVWETPDLAKLPVDGGAQRRWVLLVGVGNGAPAGGSGVQYFVGQFDGKTFTSDNPKETVLWADYGADFYAAQVWNSAPNGRHIWAGWMNNWTYAEKIPTSTWRGALTLPRELALATTLAGPRLQQQPITELQRLRGKHWNWQDAALPGAANLLADVSGETLEIIADFQINAATTADRFGFRVRVGQGEHTTIGYATNNPTLFVDRTQSGQTDFSPSFPGIHTAPTGPINGAVRVHILVDRSSVEVFGNDGLVVMTDQIFPAATSLGVEAFADGGQVTLKSLDIYQLGAARFQASPVAPASVLIPTSTP